VNFLALVAMALSKIHPAMVFNCFFYGCTKKVPFHGMAKINGVNGLYLSVNGEKITLQAADCRFFSGIDLLAFNPGWHQGHPLYLFKPIPPKPLDLFPGFCFMGT
jgi:hypothetical protein